MQVAVIERDSRMKSVKHKEEQREQSVCMYTQTHTQSHLCRCYRVEDQRDLR